MHDAVIGHVWVADDSQNAHCSLSVSEAGRAASAPAATKVTQRGAEEDHLPTCPLR